MNDLQVLRWFENPEEPYSNDEEGNGCNGCGFPEGKCRCIDSWKEID